MSARRSAQAVREYVDSRQRALSCVTDAVFSVQGGYGSESGSHLLAANKGMPIRLRGDLAIDILLTESYVIHAPSENTRVWSVRRTGYWHVLQFREYHGSPLREIVAYHWHPYARSTVVDPHLHFGNGAGTLIRPLTKAHLPTGQVSIESILRLAIEALEVAPRRPDWDAIL